MTTDVSIADAALPEPLADQFQPLLGTDDPPETYGDWVAGTAAVLEEAGFALDVDALCLTGESRHWAVVDGETLHFRCVLDAMLAPFVVADGGPVEVHTRCPTTAADVELHAGSDGVRASPADAVISFGLAVHAGPADDVETDPFLAYERFCPYINAFADGAAYDDWDGAHPDVVTTPLSPGETVALAELLVDELPEA